MLVANERRKAMRYYNDPQVRLQEGSKDQNVIPKTSPNVPDNYVRDLQQDLNALGYAAGKADGWFGSGTLEAVRRFQQDAGGTVRQAQGSAAGAGRQYNEDHPIYSGGVTGVVDQATAQELQRWKEKRWQRPITAKPYAEEDIRARLPINPNRTPRIRRPSDIDRLVLHCTDAPPSWGVFKCAEYDINPNHISPEGCPTITYAYFVNADGLVQKCLSKDVVSWHVGEWNLRSLGVALAYRATGNSEPPPHVQLEAASELFARLCLTLGLQPKPNVVGHRELWGTGYNFDTQGVKRYRKECPGWRVNLDEFRQETARCLARLKAPA
jgi:N-acetyl-anhydromuramyl-L-alanine amidase AmpD